MDDPALLLKHATLQIQAINGMVVDRLVALTIVDGGYQVQCEVVERRAVPDSQDVLGLYEFDLDAEARVRQFRRRGSRHRGDVLTERDL